MMDVKVYKDKYIIADGFIERTSSILDEIESKAVHKEEEGDRWTRNNKSTERNKASRKHK